MTNPFIIQTSRILWSSAFIGLAANWMQIIQLKNMTDDNMINYSHNNLLNKYKKYKKYKPLIDYSEFDMFHMFEPICISKDYSNSILPNYTY